MSVRKKGLRERERKCRYNSLVYDMKKGRDGITARPKCWFEEDRPKSVVKTPKSLGRWEYNCHKQARRWFSKSKATAQHENNTPMKALWTGAATTMSCLAEVATLLYSSITGPYFNSAHSLKTQTREETAKCLNQHFLVILIDQTDLACYAQSHIQVVQLHLQNNIRKNKNRQKINK